MAAPKRLTRRSATIFTLGVIHNIFSLDDFTRHKIKAAQLIGQAHFDRLLATPEQAAEHLGSFFQSLVASSLDHLNELLMDLVQQSLGVGALSLGLWTVKDQEIPCFRRQSSAAFRHPAYPSGR